MNGASLRHVATCKIQSSTGAYWLTRGVLKTVPDTFDTWFWTIDAARFLQRVHRTHVPSLDPTLQILYTECMSAEVPSIPQLLTLGMRLAYPLPAGVMELYGVVFLPRCKRPSMAIYSHSMS